MHQIERSVAQFDVDAQSPEQAVSIDARQWLARMETTYATDEQRRNHHGDSSAQQTSQEITFF